jgi:hypothetical protein
MRILNSDQFESAYVKIRKNARVLVVGSRVYPTRQDRRALYRNVLGIDMTHGPGVDRVLNLEEPLPPDLGKFDHIDCISVLEHSKHPWLLAANLERLMAVDGTIFVQVPFVWRVHAYPADFWRFTEEAVRVLLPAIKWAALQFVPDKVDNHWQQGSLYFARTQVCGFGGKL